MAGDVTQVVEAVAHGGSVDLTQVVALLAAGVIAVPIFKRLGLGSVLGYLAAGLVVGPVSLTSPPPNWGSSLEVLSCGAMACHASSRRRWSGAGALGRLSKQPACNQGIHHGLCPFLSLLPGQHTRRVARCVIGSPQCRS